MALWRKLRCSSKDLQLLVTLSGGQCFRWHRNEEDEWTGIFAKRIWTLKQTDDDILFKVTYSDSLTPVDNRNGTLVAKGKSRARKQRTQLDGKNAVAFYNEDDERLLNEYFRLDISLDDLYEKWCASDPNFKEVIGKFYGVRMLKQDPTENLFSFICSSNNHISRISSMVEKLCSLYGTLICTVGGKSFYAFPTVDSLADPSVEQVLRNSGFGYRAKFIQKSASKIQSLGGDSWLASLPLKSYEDAKRDLMELPGIGAKVADCICLMSLNHLQAIPVDTHVWQISCRYLPHLKQYKSVTEKVYNEIGNYFRELYGPLAGWAHTVLFCAELKMFQEKSSKKKRKAASSESNGDVKVKPTPQTK